MALNPLTWDFVVGGATGGLSGEIGKFITDDKAAGQLVGAVAGALASRCAEDLIGAATVSTSSAAMGAVDGGCAETILGSVLGYVTAGKTYKEVSDGK